MTWQILPASQFPDFRDQWDLLNRKNTDSPALNSAFVACGLDNFGTGKECLAVYMEGGEVRALSILQRQKFGVWDTYQPSQSPLGMWISDDHSLTSVRLGKLVKKLPGIVLQIGITQQDPTIYPRPSEQRRISTLDYIQTASITTETSFDTYWTARGKNLRHNMKRQRNRLEKEGVITKLEVVDQASDVYQAIADYGDLENAGWKSTEGTAVHKDNEQGRFYTALLTDFCQRGDGAIYQFFYGDKLVASDICIKQGGIFIILKTTYDETIKTSSPAFLMRQDIFKKIFSDSSIYTIEFYGKVMDWHTKWSSNLRTLYHLNYKIF